jgi:hypothetical protein
VKLNCTPHTQTQVYLLSTTSARKRGADGIWNEKPREKPTSLYYTWASKIVPPDNVNKNDVFAEFA